MPESIRQVLRDGRLEADTFTDVGDDQAPPEGDVIVSLDRLRRDGGMLAEGARRVGVRLAPGDDPDALAGLLACLSLVAVEFPAFNDGRGYSHAQILRRRLGYRGELRAVGDVARDQVPFMARSGFDAFGLREGEDPAQAMVAMGEITVRYQAGVTDKPTPRSAPA